MLGSCRGYNLVLLFDPYLRNWLSLHFLRNYSHRFVDQSLFLVLAAFRWSRLPVLTSKDFSGDLPPDLHFPDSDWLIGPRAVALVVVGGCNPTSVAACHIPVGSRLFSSALAASLHWKESFSSRLRLVGMPHRRHGLPTTMLPRHFWDFMVDCVELGFGGHGWKLCSTFADTNNGCVHGCSSTRWGHCFVMATKLICFLIGEDLVRSSQDGWTMVASLTSRSSWRHRLARSPHPYYRWSH